MISIQELEARGYTKDRPKRSKSLRMSCDKCGKDIARKSKAAHQLTKTCSAIANGKAI